MKSGSLTPNNIVVNLFIAKGKQCSWHFHKKKDEVFYVQSGKIKIYYGWDDNIEMS